MNTQLLFKSIIQATRYLILGVWASIGFGIFVSIIVSAFECKGTVTSILAMGWIAWVFLTSIGYFYREGLNEMKRDQRILNDAERLKKL